MLLAHRIRIDPTDGQRSYFAKAAGTARRTWNWALGEWQRQLAAGGKPNVYALKRQFNAIKYTDPDWLDAEGLPWLKTMHRDSHVQPFANLARAFARYFDELKSGRTAHRPRFKRKGRCPDSFYVANDRFRLAGRHAVLPRIGRVALCESLRFDGKIMGATVQREAGHWYLSVQVDLPDAGAQRKRSADGVVGVDLGISAAATLSTGESVASPRSLKRSMRRLRIRARRVTRKLTAAKEAAGIEGAIPKGTRLPVSNNHIKAQQALARLHARIAAVRKDFTHKLTTRLCRENQTVVIEDLNVKGMLGNRRLARSLSDIGFERDTGGNPDFAARIGAMQAQEPALRAHSGITPALEGYVGAAFAEWRLAMYLPYLTPVEFAFARANYTRRSSEWPPLIAAVRKQMDAGAAPARCDMDGLVRFLRGDRSGHPCEISRRPHGRAAPDDRHLHYAGPAGLPRGIDLRCSAIEQMKKPPTLCKVDGFRMWLRGQDLNL